MLEFVLIDTCTLYRTTARNALLWLAEDEYFTPFWSNIIEEELIRTFIKNDLKKIKQRKKKIKGDSRLTDSETERCTQDAQRRARRLIDAMNERFPDASIHVPSVSSESFKLSSNDRNDAHILQAITNHGEIDVIITDNIKDFNQIPMPNNTSVMTPDDFLYRLVNDNNLLKSNIIKIYTEKLNKYQVNHPQNIDQFIDALSNDTSENSNLSLFTALLLSLLHR